MTSPGLRERKKAKTRRAIQEHALRLFAEYGYHATTVDQIAEAAEISASTFFRYFPTKEDVVFQDEYDPMLAELFRRQPAALSPMAAYRASLRLMFTEILADEDSRTLARLRLIVSVPALRARLLDEMLRTQRTVADMVATRTGRGPFDAKVRVFAAAVAGVWIVTLIGWAEEDSSEPLVEVLDAALAELEAGLPL